MRLDWIVIVGLTLSSLTWGGTPVREVKELLLPEEEKAQPLTQARVVLADYDLLRRDFPVLSNASNDEIDRWLLKNAALMTPEQAAQETVNTSIAVSPELKRAIRPKDYNRALVFPVEGGGLLDVKGAGSLRPLQGGHSNGLATLGEGVREFLYEKMIGTVLIHAGSTRRTVGTYAIIDGGYNVIHPDGSRSPGGLIVRQASTRTESDLLGDRDALKMERLFRGYGITSAGAYREQPIEKINVQGTQAGDIIDFGGFLTVEKFEKPAKNFNGFQILLDPSRSDFIQPDPNRRIPFEVWGYTESGIADPKQDNPWRYAHRLADDFRAGKATRADFDQTARNLLKPVFERLGLPVPSDGCDVLYRLIR